MAGGGYHACVTVCVCRGSACRGSACVVAVRCLCPLALQMRIHSPSPHKLPVSQCSDYFFNYFTFGLVRMCACVCVCVCMRACVCMHACMCVYEHVYVCMCVYILHIYVRVDLRFVDPSSISK